MRGISRHPHNDKPPQNKLLQLEFLAEDCSRMRHTVSAALSMLDKLSDDVAEWMREQRSASANAATPVGPPPPPPGADVCFGGKRSWASQLREQRYDSVGFQQQSVPAFPPLPSPEDPPLGVRDGFTPPAWLKEAGFNVIWRAEGDWWAATGHAPWTGTSLCLNHLNFTPPDLPAYTQPKFTVIKL